MEVVSFVAHRIVVINPKGGSGKTTIATNIASYYATQEPGVSLLDYDSQGSSCNWLKRREQHAPAIHGIAAYEVPPGMTRSFAHRVPHDATHVVVDTPAAYAKKDLDGYIRGADKIVVPVLPSEIDIQAAARTIGDLLLVARIDRHANRLGVVANRVRTNTVIFRALMRFLSSLSIPIVGQFRDTQNYVHAARSGAGIFELGTPRAEKDLAQWRPFIAWLDAAPCARAASQHSLSAAAGLVQCDARHNVRRSLF